MTKAIRFDVEADEEFVAAMGWYEEQRDNLGFEFLAAVREATDRIAETPQGSIRVPGLAAGLNVRRFVLRRFPYAIVYVELDAEIRVIAVAHTSRKPYFWIDRIRSR